MSFYGNVTNTSRTHFQFDRIYSSRKEMETHKSEDGIYAGRYVLVEYDNQMHLDTFLRVTKRVREDNKFVYYAMLGGSQPEETRLTKGNIHPDTIVYTSAFEQSSSGGHFAKNCIFYKCVSSYEEGNTTDPAEFIEIVDQAQYIYLGAIEECMFQENMFYTKNDSQYILANSWNANDKYYILSNYISNHAIDEKCYGRGYDSTVWQKVYVGGKEKYIMIAELNTIVPAFDIDADAPTQAPIAPHFDLESSDLYYKMHYQPSWGLRVKSARLENGKVIDREGNELSETVNYSTIIPDETKSDETTIWSRDTYNPKTGEVNTLYWHAKERQPDGVTGIWENSIPTAPTEDEQDERVPAAIYYNKAGFSVDKNVIDNMEDCISLTPSGQSGQQYNNHNGTTNTKSPAPDIQELSIMLPSLGNTVAKMWNLIYGEGTLQEGELVRNKDIDWDSKNGLRMVNIQPDGNGYTYEPEKTATLAGAINSVHDLMGMIIVNNNDTMDPASADYDHIYYYNNQYHRKHVTYDYEPIELSADRKIPAEMTYRQVTWDFDSFPPRECYYGDSDSVVYHLETNNYPTYGTDYVTVDDDKETFFTQVDIVNYDSTIFYKKLDDITITENYKGSGYVNGQPSPDKGVYYYTLNVEATKYLDDLQNKRPYIPNAYYLYNGGEALEGELDAIDNLLDKFELCITPISEFNPEDELVYYLLQMDDTGNILFSRQEVFNPLDYPNLYYSTIDESGHKFIHCYSGDNVIITPRMVKDESVEFFLINEESSTKYFYFPREYYTVTQWSDTDPSIAIEFTQCPEEMAEDEKQYYIKTNKIKKISLNPQDYLQEGYSDNTYYISHTYYYKLDNGQYVIDRSLTPTKNNSSDYFIKDNFLYVIKDNNEYFGIGAEWNPSIENVPEEVTLATRKPTAEMRVLDGFADNLNTIHGLILQMNKIMELEDPYTRDTATVQGTINLLNDIIHKFEIIAPGQFVTVDEYGRIHSTLHTTSQSFNTENYGQNLNNVDNTEISATENRWIDINIDSNAVEPKITILHNFTKVDDTTSSSTQDTSISSGDIKLYAPIVDNMGHIVGHNTETIELPHGFRNIALDGETIEANSHVATLNLEGDPWIKWQLNNDEQKLLIAHGPTQAGGDFGYHTSPGFTTDHTSLNFGDTFIVPSVKYDDNGHIITMLSFDATLPILKIDGGASAGYILSGVNENGTELTKTLLTSVVLTGYTGTQENVTATSTLGGALQTITDSISNIKNSYATLEEVQALINTLKTNNNLR